MGNSYILIFIMLFGIIGSVVSYLDADLERSKIGLLKYILAGMVGAVLAVALGVAVFKINLPVSLELTRDLMFVLGFSVLGGYASLNLLPMLSSLALRRLQRKI